MDLNSLIRKKSYFYAPCTRTFWSILVYCTTWQVAIIIHNKDFICSRQWNILYEATQSAFNLLYIYWTLSLNYVPCCRDLSSDCLCVSYQWKPRLLSPWLDAVVRQLKRKVQKDLILKGRCHKKYGLGVR